MSCLARAIILPCPTEPEHRATLIPVVTGILGAKVGDGLEKDVNIIGKTVDGRCAGLKTQVIET